jgi:hypothetical protein
MQAEGLAGKVVGIVGVLATDSSGPDWRPWKRPVASCLSKRADSGRMHDAT